jgi:hypothetical protein
MSLFWKHRIIRADSWLLSDVFFVLVLDKPNVREGSRPRDPRAESALGSYSSASRCCCEVGYLDYKN